MDDGIIFNEERWPWYTKPIPRVSNFQSNGYVTTDSLGNFIISEDIENKIEGTNMDINKLKPIKVKFYNRKTTVIWWNDNTKTSVVCDKEDTFSEETGVAMCYLKKIYGNTGKYMNKINKAVALNKEKHVYAYCVFTLLDYRADKPRITNHIFKVEILKKNKAYSTCKVSKAVLNSINELKKKYKSGTKMTSDIFTVSNKSLFRTFNEAYYYIKEIE